LLIELSLCVFCRYSNQLDVHNREASTGMLHVCHLVL